MVYNAPSRGLCPWSTDLAMHLQTTLASTGNGHSKPGPLPAQVEFITEDEVRERLDAQK
jgi:hypothetical protein